MGFVVKRGENYSARLAIPKALRSILGRNEFKKSLGTTSKKEAELLAAPLVLRWKKLTLFAVCAFEVALILFVVAWTALADVLPNASPEEQYRFAQC